MDEIGHIIDGLGIYEFLQNSHHDFRDFNGGNFQKIRYMPKMPIFTAFPAALMAGIFIKFAIRPKPTSR